MMDGGGGEKIVIVVKKRARRGAHHGGSWKVAYADFVTAMMAFFLVMWIVGMESDVKDLVQGYFNNPVGFRSGYAAGMTPLSTGSSPLDDALHRMPRFVREVEERRFHQARDQILEGLQTLEGSFALPEVWVDVVEGGLRIELRERDVGDTSFAFGSDEVRPGMVRALGVVGEALIPLSAGIVIEGHTDAVQYGSEGYTNWELSVDRANAARRTLLRAGVPADRVAEVRGYADRRLLNVQNPLSPENRRVTILVPFASTGSDGSAAVAPRDGVR